MSDLLGRLAARAVQAPAVLPRLATRFEGAHPRVPAGVAVVEEWIDAAPARAGGRDPAQPAKAGAVEADARASAIAAAHRLPAEAPVDHPMGDTAPPSEARPVSLAPVVSLSPAAVVVAPALAPAAGAAGGADAPRAAPVEGGDVGAGAPEAPMPMPLTIEHVLRIDLPSPQSEPSASRARDASPAAPRHTEAARAPRAAHAAMVATPSPVVEVAPLHVEISIGRIEVKAVPTGAPPQVVAPQAHAGVPPLSLERLLQQRRGERP